MANRKSKPTEAQYRKAYEEALRTYGHRATVTRIDVGNKYSQGKRTAVKSVRFHVQEKLALEALEPAEIFPDEIGGVPTDVVQADFDAHELLDERRHPTLAQSFPNGVITHDFYRQPSTQAAFETILKAYGLGAEGDPAAAVQAALRGRTALVALDGAEQAEDLGDVRAAIPVSCGQLMTTRRRTQAPDTA